jgi:hypothetical protein
MFGELADETVLANSFFHSTELIGGLVRNRTGMQGFAILCVTTPPRGPTDWVYIRRILTKQQRRFFFYLKDYCELTKVCPVKSSRKVAFSLALLRLESDFVNGMVKAFLMGRCFQFWWKARIAL